eukprot:scaffold118644_cov71-Phaeocystis_antarctica.AAC.2
MSRLYYVCWQHGPWHQRRIRWPALAWVHWQAEYRRCRAAAVVFSFLQEACRAFFGVRVGATSRRGGLLSGRDHSVRHVPQPDSMPRLPLSLLRTEKPKHRVIRLKVAPLRQQNVNESVDDLSYSEHTDSVWESPACRRVSSLKPVAKVPRAGDCLFRTT